MNKKKSKKEVSKKKNTTIQYSSEIPKESLKTNKAEIQILKHNIEAVLFAAGKALELSFIADLCGSTGYMTKKQLNILKTEYGKNSSVLMIINQDTTWKMTVREQYLDVVRKIVADTELSRAVLETLSMIAYRNPALQSEVVKARGTSTYEHIAELVKLGFLLKEAIGRSYILKLSEKFYEYFEIDGKKIKEVFQPVKDRADQQLLLGNMKIVNAQADISEKKDIFADENNKDNKEERLGELEVIRIENQKHAESINNMRHNHTGFLDDIDQKISAISDRTAIEEKGLNEIKSSDVQVGVDSMKSQDELLESNNSEENSLESNNSEKNSSESEFTLSEKSDDYNNSNDNSEDSNLNGEDKIIADAEEEVKKVQKLVVEDTSEE